MPAALGLRNLAFPLMIGIASFIASCDKQILPRDFREVEILSESSLGQMPMDANHSFANSPEMMRPGMSGSSAPLIDFEIPDGWEAKASSGMRAATFSIAGKEATLVILPNTHDGYASNIRRWLGQLGMELSESRLESFIKSRETFATPQNLSGSLFDFTQLKDLEGDKGFMLAAMIDAGNRAVFVKMVGDADFLRHHKEGFLSLSKSIRLQDDVAETSEEQGDGSDIATGGLGMPGTVMRGSNMQSSDPAFNRVSEGVSRLTWKTPSSWKQLTASGMRTGSFSVTLDGKSADGSIVQLSGPAGGVESNVRRWMEQVGMTQPDEASMKEFLQSQQRIKTQDGYEGILINLASRLGGNLVQDNSILAAIIHAPGETIFVKLTGPRSVLLQNVEPLAQLSSSLSLVK